MNIQTSRTGWLARELLSIFDVDVPLYSVSECVLEINFHNIVFRSSQCALYIYFCSIFRFSTASSSNARGIVHFVCFNNDDLDSEKKVVMRTFQLDDKASNVENSRIAHKVKDSLKNG